MPISSISKGQKAVWGTLLGLFLWAYWSTFVRTLDVWRSDPDYTHGFLVLPIAWAIWWRRRERFEGLPSHPSVSGLLLVALAALLRIVAARYYLMPLDAWSIPIWMAGAIWTFSGWRALRIALPALAFLWFAAPLPERVELLLSVPLQERAATASAWILQSACQPAVAAGTTLLMGAEVFEVENACSGLRMFFGTFAMAVAFVLLGSYSRPINVVLLLAAAPIAIVANILRIVITAISVQYSSSEVLRRLVHDASGLLMVGTVFGLYCLVLYLLRRSITSYQTNRDRFMRLLPVWPTVVAAIGILATVWHDRQERRVFDSLLNTAALYEQSQEWDRAADYLYRYIQLQRDDVAALRRLAQATHRAAQTLSSQHRALSLLTAAAKANPGDLALAVEQAELAWDLRQFNQAIVTATSVLQDPEIEAPEHREERRLAARIRAWAMYEALANSDGFASFGWTDVADALANAARIDSDLPQHAFRLAIVYREHLNSPSQAERNQFADRQIDELVEANPELAEAWLIRYRYRRRFSRGDDTPYEVLTAIDADLDRALELDEQSEPRNVHVLVAAAERMRERGNMDASLASYQLALQVQPLDVRPYLAIAEIWIERGTVSAREKAVDVLSQGLSIIGPTEIPLMFPLIEQLDVLERNAEAEAVVQQVLDSLERFPEPIRTTYRVQLQQVQSWRMAKRGEFISAGTQLQDVLDALSSKYVHVSRNYVAQAWANVGQYFRMANDWDAASLAYQRAAALDDAWRLEYRWAVARQSETRGDLDAAAQQYREIASAADVSQGAWIQAASAALRQQMLLPIAVRDWTHFRRAIDAAKIAMDSEQDQVIVLEANQLLVVGQQDRVVRVLLEGIKQYPLSIPLHRSLALLQSRRGDLTGALRTAEQLQVAPLDPLPSVLLRKELLCEAGRFDDAVRLLEDTLNHEDLADPLSLQLELAWIYMQRARWSDARRWLEVSRKADPDDMRATEVLSELAWCTEDWKLLEQCESSLRTVEGTYGPLWRTFRIRRLMAQSSKGTDVAAQAEVDSLARQLEVLYPHMQQTRIAAGRVATYRGLMRRAVANYEEAWELGLPRVSLAVDLISLLNELGESDRAQRYVREVRRYLSATQKVIDQSFLEFSNESADEAIRMAEALVADAPRSDSYLRLGRTLVLTALPEQRDYEDRLRRAEVAFRRAVEIDPTNTRTWAALFRYLVAVKPDPLESQAVLAGLEERQDISLLNRTFALAQLNESTDNFARANRLYRETIRLAEDHPIADEKLMVLERAAQYFRRFDPELSEQCCRQSLQIDATAIGPQQILLELLLAKQDAKAADEARQLAASFSEPLVGADQSKRLQARVLQETATWSDDATASRRRAIDLLQDVTNKSNEDALTLAELYLQQSQVPLAVSELRLVAKDLPPDSTQVLDFLRRFDKQLYSDTRLRLLAERIYDQLEELPVDGLAALDQRLETIEERSGGSYADRHSVGSSLIQRHARRAIALAVSEPQQWWEIVQLMRHLVLIGRWDDAQQLTELRPELLPVPRTAAALASALAMSNASQENVIALTQTFDTWLRDYPDDTELLFSVANLRFMAGENQRAAELFRRCLEKQPHHTPSLNNLALALALMDAGSLDESYRLIGRAIELDGRRPEWLDTMAVLHLLQADYEPAVALLLEALPNASNDEMLFLHLTKAWLEQGNLAMAEFGWSRVVSGVKPDQAMLPFDQAIYDSLLNQLREVK